MCDCINLIHHKWNVDTESANETLGNKGSSIRFCRTFKKGVFVSDESISSPHFDYCSDDLTCVCTHENPSDGKLYVEFRENRDEESVNLSRL